MIPHHSDLFAEVTRNEINKMRCEFEDNPTAQSKFNYAWGLVQIGSGENDMALHKGCELLEELYRDSLGKNDELLYYISLANYKRKSYKEALLQLKKVKLGHLGQEKNFQEFEKELTSAIQRDGYIGAGVVGTLIAAAGLALIALFKK